MQSPPNAVMLLSRSRRYRTQRGLLVPLTPSTDPPTRAATPSLISGQLMHSRLLRSTSRGKPVHVFTEVAGSTNHLNAWYGLIYCTPSFACFPSPQFPCFSSFPISVYSHSSSISTDRQQKGKHGNTQYLGIACIFLPRNNSNSVLTSLYIH